MIWNVLRCDILMQLLFIKCLYKPNKTVQIILFLNSSNILFYSIIFYSIVKQSVTLELQSHWDKIFKHSNILSGTFAFLLKTPGLKSHENNMPNNNIVHKSMIFRLT